jgi:5-azacytidine-induced protein 1
LNINNDIFTPNSNLNLNFNDNSKNIFSPLKNTDNTDERHNLYNPLFTNQNNSITEEVKEIIKNTGTEKKDNYVNITENNRTSQSITQQSQNNNLIKVTEPSIINPVNIVKNNTNISSISENKMVLQESKNKNDTLNISNNSYYKPDDKVLNTTNNKPNQYLDESKFNMISNTTNEKINQILSYLDDTKKYSPKRNNSINFTAPNVSSYNPPIRQTSAEILNMALELKEYKNTVATMKQVIEDLKQVSRQKDDYYKDQYISLQEKVNSDIAMIISNKDGIIDNLVAEKKAIVYEMESIKEELSKQELSYNKKIALMNDNFEAERKKDKDAWYVAEKARRKKWEETKLKEIKEMTIKGLEPEIERILQNHKQEMVKWEENLNEELRKQKERLNKEFEKRLIEQREKSHKEKEEALEHERTLFQQRARNQSERFEDEYSEERRRWNSNLTAEINKVEALREKDRKIHEEEIRILEEKNRKVIEEKDEIHKEKVLDLEKRMNEKMALEVESVRFRLNKEKEAFIEEKQKEYDSKYNTMKNEIMKDKEKQIELIIQKLGDETISERRKIQLECETKAEERNRILKIENEQMRNKIVELNDKLSGETKVRIMLDENLNVLSKKLIDFEHENAKKDKKILELTSSLNDFKDKYSNLSKEFSKDKMGIETDYQIKIDKHISDQKIMTEKLESLKNYYENKIAEMKQFHESQINMLDSRVKKKLDSKEEVIKKLEEEVEYKKLTIQKYEEMISRQRKELLMN